MLGEGTYAQVFKVNLRREIQPGCVSVHMYTMIVFIIITQVEFYHA